MALILAMDTGYYLRESCFVFGSQVRADNFYNRINIILGQAGHQGDMHWKRIRKPQRKKALPPLTRAMKNSGLVFFYFKHKRTRNISPKKFFLNYLPREMSYYFEEYLKNATGYLSIQTDNDFDCVRKKGSEIFLYMLMKRISSRLANAEVTPKKTGKNFVVIVRKSNKARLHITGKVTTSNEKAISLADVSLGVIRTSKRKPDRVIIIKLA